MTYERPTEEDEVPSSMLFSNDVLRWSSQPDYSQPSELMSLQAVPTTTTPSTTTVTSPTTTTTNAPVPTINTTNPALAPPPPILDPTKQYHPEWGVIKDGDFHALTHKHQHDLEGHYQTNDPISDFYFWQANLGGYCMADMIQGKLNHRGKYETRNLYAIMFRYCCFFRRCFCIGKKNCGRCTSSWQEKKKTRIGVKK